jgi:molybdate transport system substrate-binding protein
MASLPPLKGISSMATRQVLAELLSHDRQRTGQQVEIESVGGVDAARRVALQQLFERWGIADEMKQRTVQAPPGVPVGTLVARGDVALGFQQLSELMHLDGIDVVGPLPDAIQITTTFSAGICAVSSQAGAVRKLLESLAAPEAAQAKLRNGMAPAASTRKKQ